jgi:subtilisin family serine protease
MTILTDLRAGLLSLLLAIAACAAEPGAQPEVQARAAALAGPSHADVVWVLMKDQANLEQARSISDWAARGAAVRAALLATASDKQQAIQRYLVSRSVKYEPFWIVNALRVRADAATIEQLRSRPDVAGVSAEQVYSIPEPQPSAAANGSVGLTWGLSSIRAPEAWQSSGSHGEGIVIGSIDSGVQFDHPTLVRQYRGHHNGGFDHNYNWHDPSHVCGNPSLVPCDNTAHGTHTMGTMVGLDESGAHAIGVSPGARWITAKGCEDRWCSTYALLSAAQWMLAPTDLNGQNPRPDLRPNLVSNSWSSSPGDTFLAPIVQAWVAAGMFPVFAAGNNGPSCGTASSPSDFPESYSVAAYDVANMLAPFSGRGSGALGAPKPNIAAPGVDVVSSVPGNGYFALSGTSMATPHVAGSIALLWSAVPSLRGDIQGTRALLDKTAVDTGDWNCGGDKANNASWGEGKLDLYAAVASAQAEELRGQLVGSVSSDDVPLARATITARAAGQPDRFIMTDDDGSYALGLPIGSYSIEARAFGYETSAIGPVEITEDSAVATPVSLEPAQTVSISGAVVDDKGAAIPFATVTAVGAPIDPISADVRGQYTLSGLPVGSYVLSFDAYGCYEPKQLSVAAQSTRTLNVTLPRRHDKYGYGCQIYGDKRVPADQPLLTAGDDESRVYELPFPFLFYGKEYKSVTVSINGALSFQPKPFVFANGAIPSPTSPNAAIYALWHDYVVGGAGGVFTGVHGTAPRRLVVLEWRNVRVHPGENIDKTFNFSIVLHETGEITLQYGASDAAKRYGELATIGIEDEAGSDGLMYSLYRTSLVPGMSLRYSVAQAGIVRGTLRDANDAQPLSGVMVAAMRGQQRLRTVATDKGGKYLLQVPAGSTTVVVNTKHYEQQERAVTVSAGQTTQLDLVLRTAIADVEPNAIELIAAVGKSNTRELLLKNQGSAPLHWSFQQTGANQPKPGEVLKTLTPPVLLPWGVGMTDNLWISDLYAQQNIELTSEGIVTGRVWPPEWPNLALDMAYDTMHKLMCQVDFSAGYSIGLPCWDPNTGRVEASISGDHPWTQVPQRGVAYVPNDDTFYIGGPDHGVIYHIAGLSHDHPGEVISQCQPPDRGISGLAWNASKRVLWEATNSPSDTLFELDPDDCSVLSAIAHPAPGYNGAGLELDAHGDLWMVAQSLGTVYLVASGVPTFESVPWLSTTPSSDTLAPGDSASVTLTVNSSGLEPGAYNAAVFLESDAARGPSIRIPVSLVVTDYQRAIDSGSDFTYTDAQLDTWSADRRYVSGEWGYLDNAQPVRSAQAIAGTADPALYQSLLLDPSYRFDNVPNGVYAVELRFAAPSDLPEEPREFDVIVENEIVLPAYNPAARSGLDQADEYTFFVPVNDGQLDVRFSPRAGQPFVNALRVTHRPDR